MEAGCESCRVELQKGIHYAAVEVSLNYRYDDGEKEKKGGKRREDAISIIEATFDFSTFCCP